MKLTDRKHCLWQTYEESFKGDLKYTLAGYINDTLLKEAIAAALGLRSSSSVMIHVEYSQ